MIASRTMLRVASPLVILLLWQVAAWAGLTNPNILPAPVAIIADLGKLIASGALAKALAVSLYRVVSGFAIAVVAGVLIGALMGRIAWVEDILDPIVELLRPVSPLALFPGAILWVGRGDGSKIFVIALAASFPVILNTYAGVRGIDPAYFRASESLGASNWEIFRGVVLPGSLPHIFTGVRLAWGISLIVIIAAEMVGASQGIGYMVLEAQQTFRTERVFSGIVVIGLVGFLTDLGFRWLRRALLPWYRENRT